MALVTFVTPIRTQAQSKVEKGFHKVFSPGPMNRCAATAWAVSRMISFQNELHMHPSRQSCVLLTVVAKGVGLKQTTANTKWERPSYSSDTTNFNAGAEQAFCGPLSCTFHNMSDR